MNETLIQLNVQEEFHHRLESYRKVLLFIVLVTSSLSIIDSKFIFSDFFKPKSKELVARIHVVFLYLIVVNILYIVDTDIRALDKNYSIYMHIFMIVLCVIYQGLLIFF